MNELNERIKKSGIKKGYIAKELNISNQAMSNKLGGKTPFTTKEAYKVKLLLGLSNDEFVSLFFAQEVEKGVI